MNIDCPEEYYPLAVLMDELCNPNLKSRIKSVSSLTTIALALGPDLTRTDLLRFLQEEVIDDEYEVVETLVSELASFIPLVGGSEHCHLLVPLLETVAGLEDTMVRDKAVQTLITLMSLIEVKHIKPYVELIHRLGNSNWFCSRNSCTSLVSTIYQRCENEQERTNLLQLYQNLCQDDAPMVRRAAASKLGKWRLQDMIKNTYIKGLAEVLKYIHVKTTAVEMFKNLAKDEQDSVRLLAVEGAVHICTVLERRDCEALMYPLLMDGIVKDKSWRVRFMLGDKYPELYKATGSSGTVQNLFASNFIVLLKDVESEVRAVAAGKISEFCHLLEPVFAKEYINKRLLPLCTTQLITDSSQYVRAALAKNIMCIAEIAGKQEAEETFMDLFIKLLNDTFPDVRLNLLHTLGDLSKVVGISMVSDNLLPSIIELSQDRQWRIRLAIIEFIPILSEQLGIVFFDEKLSSLCVKFLNDFVFAIRKAAIKNIEKLTEIFGSDWALASLLPQVLVMCEHDNYLQRMTTLFVFNSICKHLDVKLINEYIVPSIKNMVDDNVPNVRFNVSKTMTVVLHNLESRKQECEPESTTASETSIIELRTLLQRGTQDPDVDVRYFSQVGLEPVASSVN